MASELLKNKKILMIIAQKDFRDEELLEPKKIFEDYGARVTVASNTGQEATGMLGVKVKPDMAIEKARIHDYDAMVLIGGGGSPTYLWENKAVHGMAQHAKKENKVVAAICLSPAVLAKAGLLKGIKATVWDDPNAIDALKKNGAFYVKEHVVVEGKIITADGPTAAKEFGEAVAKAIAN
jgi:protease I